jgi:hypothetical protein
MHIWANRLIKPQMTLCILVGRSHCTTTADPTPVVDAEFLTDAEYTCAHLKGSGRSGGSSLRVTGCSIPNRMTPLPMLRRAYIRRREGSMLRKWFTQTLASRIGGNHDRHRRCRIELDILYDAGLLDQEAPGDKRLRRGLHLDDIIWLVPALFPYRSCSDRRGSPVAIRCAIVFGNGMY